MKDRKRAHNFIDLTGQIFERLTVIKYLYTKNKKARWLCKCICGNPKDIIAPSGGLRSGMYKSCGCFKNEINSIIHKTHGFKTGTKTQRRFYHIWQDMKRRCLNPNRKRFNDYGGRGIKVCDRWLESFENFRDDMWESYNKHIENFGENNTSLDRIDVNGNYESSNCKWATRLEQAQNTRSFGVSINRKEHLYWRLRIGSTLSRLIAQNSKNSKFIEPYLGCTLLEFRSYIESLWLPSMSWSNYGKGIGKWSFDHIRGCNNFDLSKEEDRFICYFYTNIQPLWDVDHMKKSKILIPA